MSSTAITSANQPCELALALRLVFYGRLLAHDALILSDFIFAHCEVGYENTRWPLQIPISSLAS
jgi:hypothetical protein